MQIAEMSDTTLYSVVQTTQAGGHSELNKVATIILFVTSLNADHFAKLFQYF